MPHIDLKPLLAMDTGKQAEDQVWLGFQSAHIDVIRT